MKHKDNVRNLSSGVKYGLSQMYRETIELQGEVFFELKDAETGNILSSWGKKNKIVLDSGILISRLLKDKQEPANSVNMLAVGTGATGDLINPDAPLETQRRLGNEIARKTFAEKTFRDSEGVATAFPTNIVDYTCIFSQSEAVGPLNEMGLVSTISNNPLIKNENPNFSGSGGAPYDPTVDVSLFDNFINYLTFGVVTKPNNSILTITWRITA